MRATMATPKRREFYIAHVCNLTVGHNSSDDCWCEPIIYWIKNKDAPPILVIEHDDDTPVAHYLISAGRAKNPDWITRVLETIQESEPE